MSHVHHSSIKVTEWPSIHGLVVDISPAKCQTNLYLSYRVCSSTNKLKGIRSTQEPGPTPGYIPPVLCSRHYNTSTKIFLKFEPLWLKLQNRVLVPRLIYLSGCLNRSVTKLLRLLASFCSGYWSVESMLALLALLRRMQLWESTPECYAMENAMLWNAMPWRMQY